MATQAVAVHNGAHAGALATTDASMFLPVMQMEQAVLRWNAVNEFVDKMFREGIDYGIIPGTPKPSLLKPGAERICTFFGWAIRFECVDQIESWDGEEPMAFYKFRCSLWRGDYFIGEALGSASTRESKYRYRWVPEEDVPSHLAKDRLMNKDGTRTLKEYDFGLKKRETTGKWGKPESYWAEFDAAKASGKLKQETVDLKGKSAIQFSVTIASRLFRVPNPDICDQFNTALKMAQKRAHVAVALNAGNLSDRFTQDIEDILDTTATRVDEGGSQAAADAVAQQKIADLQKQQAATIPGKGGVAPADGGRGTNGQVSAPDTAAAPAGIATPGAQKAATPAAAPHAAVEEMVPPNDEVADLWKRMGGKKGSIMEALAHLKHGIEQYTGGDIDWYRLLGENGAKLPDDLLDPAKGGGLRKVRTFAAAAWLFIRKCQESAERVGVGEDAGSVGPETSDAIEPDDKDDWVPDNIGAPRAVKAEVVA